ncbi:C-terminal binding protein [candidate division KSB1 bacterium]|nr:C-terminal binding protein [candidate division KSB1 bacterium]
MDQRDEWKIVITDYIEDDLNWERDLFAKMKNIMFEAHQLKHRPLSQIIAATKDADILVVNMVKLNREIIRSLNQCKLVIRHGVGYDNVDVDALSDRGIMFINIPDYCIHEVAEQTIMLIMCCVRKFAQQKQAMSVSMEKGDWDCEVAQPIYRLYQKTLGIIGCGRIGSAVLQMMCGFQMRCLVCDPYLTPERKHELGIETVPLETVLRESDVITLHTPLNNETRHMISHHQLNMMKQHACIINTARGGVIDENALIEACESGRIAAAGIDVFEFREPPSASAKLLKIERLYTTPHLGWYSVESERAMRERVVEQILNFIHGKIPDNVINPQVLSSRHNAEQFNERGLK